MSLENYWIGKDIELDKLWNDYDQGGGFINKFQNTTPYLLRLRFTGHPINLPLFDHEVIYKTVKSTFHDVKEECLTLDRYNQASPIFLYRVNRGSGEYEFLAQLDTILAYVAAIGGLIYGNKKLMGMDVEISKSKWKFITEEFPDASDEDKIAYMKAWTTWGQSKALSRLIKQGLDQVEISKNPITNNTKPDQIEMFKFLKSGEKNDEEE